MGTICGKGDGVKIACVRCMRHGRATPNEASLSFKQGRCCRQCYAEMEAEEKMVFEHNLGNHDLCKNTPSFPESQLKYESPDYYDQRKGEERVSEHGDCRLCVGRD